MQNLCIILLAMDASFLHYTLGIKVSPHIFRSIGFGSSDRLGRTGFPVMVSLKLKLKVSLPGCSTRSRKKQANIGLRFFL